MRIQQIVRVIEMIIQIGILASLFVLITAGLINIQYGLDDMAMMSVFASDEPFAVGLLVNNLNTGRLDPQDFYNYGYGYHSLAFSLIQVFKAVNYTIDQRFIATTLRLLSFQSYLLVLGLMYIFTRQLTRHRIIALCATWFLAAISDLYFFAQFIHPDLLQTLLILLAVWVACQRQRVWSALLAAFIAGLAFGTKYSGVFVLPFLGVPALLAYIHHKRESQQRFYIRDYGKIAGQIAAVGLGMGVLFGAAWLITNPTVLTHLGETLKDIGFEQHHVSLGNKWADPKNPLLWFPVFFQEFRTPGSVLMVTGGVMLVVWFVAKRRAWSSLIAEPLNRTILTLTSYVGIGSLHILLLVNARTPRYTFHLLPCLILLAFFGLDYLTTTAMQRNTGLWRSMALFGIAASILPMTAHSLHRMESSSAKYYHQYLKASQWIADRYPADIPILADAYSYQSPKFTNYLGQWGIDEQMVAYYQPFMLIINKTMSGRWSWKEDGTKFSDLKFVMGKDPNHGGPHRIYDFHLKLFAPSSPYRVVYEDTDIVVLHDRMLDESPEP